jgi:hypothetical protein
MRLHLFGDSVLRGVKTDICDNPAESLRPLQSPASIMNLAVGRPFAAFRGETGIPKAVPEAEAAIAQAFASREIVAGDAVALLDVGPHAMDTRRHEADWTRLRRAATGAHDVRLIMCSGFDNGARGEREMQHEALLDGRSPNDAVRAAATAAGEFAGTTSFLDVATPLRRLHESLAPRRRVSPYFPDEVHLTVWGQIFLSLLILKQLPVRLAGLGRLAQVMTQNRKRLGIASRADVLDLLRITAAAAGVRSQALELPFLASRAWESADRRVGAALGRRSVGAHKPSALVASMMQQAGELERKGALEEALAGYRRAAAEDGELLDAHRGWLRTAAGTGRPEEMIEAARAALTVNPSEGKAYVWAAEAMLATRAGPELVGWLDRLAEAHAPPRAFEAMAELTRALGDPDRARMWSERRAFGRRSHAR